MTRRQKAIAVVVAFTVLLVTAAVVLNISWVVINARRAGPLVLGVVTFALLITGIIVYTVFLVAEIRRNEDHDTFINAVTHELKTPIASMRLYLETLQSRAVPEEQRQQFYRVMLEDAERLHRTVDQVLKAGAAAQRPKSGARARVDVTALARECVAKAVASHHLPESAIALEVHDETPMLVQGDAEELRTVLVNLLDNAVKYSGESVRVTVALAAPSPSTLWLRVQDRGLGISKKHLKRVFNRFYRVHARGRRFVKGSGLGLYIVRSIARAHGGRVFVASEGEGHGTTFTVELPRIVAS